MNLNVSISGSKHQYANQRVSTLLKNGQKCTRYVRILVIRFSLYGRLRNESYILPVRY